MENTQSTLELYGIQLHRVNLKCTLYSVSIIDITLV